METPRSFNKEQLNLYWETKMKSYLKYGTSKHASQKKSLMYVMSSRLSKSSVT